MMEENIVKRKILMLTMGLMLVMSLTACDADKVNTAIHSVGDAAGVDTTNINIEQKTIDEVEDKVNDAIETGNKIIKDEGVNNAVKGVVDAVKNAASNETNQSSPE